MGWKRKGEGEGRERRKETQVHKEKRGDCKAGEG